MWVLGVRRTADSCFGLESLSFRALHSYCRSSLLFHFTSPPALDMSSCHGHYIPLPPQRLLPHIPLSISICLHFNHTPLSAPACSECMSFFCCIHSGQAHSASHLISQIVLGFHYWIVWQAQSSLWTDFSQAVPVAQSSHGNRPLVETPNTPHLVFPAWHTPSVAGCSVPMQGS